MPSKNPAQRLRDIVDNIDAIEVFTAGMEPRGTTSARRTITWPGNVRELRDLLERAAILADGLIVTEHLALAPRPRISGEGQAASSDLSAVERAMHTCP